MQHFHKLLDYSIYYSIQNSTLRFLVKNSKGQQFSQNLIINNFSILRNLLGDERNIPTLGQFR